MPLSYVGKDAPQNEAGLPSIFISNNMILNIPPSVVRHHKREYVELVLIMTNVGFSVLGGVDLALEVVGDVDDATFRCSLLVHSRDWPDGMIGSWAPGVPPI